MKFYKRFPGDITIKTGDLTLVEFGAYDRLLDHYYAKEKPIEAHRAYTVARCQSAADRQAVDRVLAEFWTLTDAGWVQQRADEMIAEALPKIEAARENGKKGGRPLGSTKKPSGLFPETQPITETVTFQKTSQSQNKKEQEKPPHPPAGGAGGFDRFWQAWPTHRRKVAQKQCRAKWATEGCESIAEQVIAHVEAMKTSQAWLKDGGEFIPAPMVYLNQRRWEAGMPDAPSLTVAASETVEQYTARRERERAAEEAERLELVSPQAKAARDAVLARAHQKAAA